MPDKKDQSIISVRVSPRSSKNEVTGLNEGVLYIKVAATPEKGKANYELVDFLSKRLGVSKERIEIIRGHNGRNKTIAIKGLTEVEAMKRLLPG